MVTVPGEALLELGWNIRNDSLKLGFTNTLLAGYRFLKNNLSSNRFSPDTAIITWAILQLLTNMRSVDTKDF